MEGRLGTWEPPAAVLFGSLFVIALYVCDFWFQELLEDGQMDQFHKALIELNMDSPEELQSYIQKLSAAVEQAKQKILQAEVNLEVDVVDSKPEVTKGLERETI